MRAALFAFFMHGAMYALDCGQRPVTRGVCRWHGGFSPFMERPLARTVATAVEFALLLIIVQHEHPLIAA